MAVEAGREFKSVILAGSSGTGKTTVMQGLGVPELRDFIAIPQRCSTRPPRSGDDPNEILHIKKEVFEAEVAAGLINPSWRRNIDIGKNEYYGFYALPENEERLPIYHANNALLRNAGEEAAKFIAGGLLVVLTATKEDKDKRLAQRTDMRDSERRVRRIEDDMVIIEHPAEIIHTSGLTPEEGQEAFRTIIKTTLAFNAQVRSGRFTGSYQEFKQVKAS